MAKIKPEDKNEDLQTVGKEVYEEFGFCDEGVNRLKAIIAQSAVLREQAIHQVAWETLTAFHRYLRGKLSRQAIHGDGDGQPESNGETHQPKTYSPEFKDAARAALRGLLKFPMRDHRPLANANRQMMLKDAEDFLSTAKGNGRSGKFLLLVANKMREKMGSEHVQEIIAEKVKNLLHGLRGKQRKEQEEAARTKVCEEVLTAEEVFVGDEGEQELNRLMQLAEQEANKSIDGLAQSKARLKT